MVQDLKTPYLRLLLGSLPGGGLTRTGATWPDPLFLGVAGRGGMPAPNLRWQEHDLPGVMVSTPDELTDMVGTLSDPATREGLLGLPLSTLVVDTIEQLERFLGADRDVARKWWQALTTLPLHVVLLCHLRHEGSRLALDSALGDEAPAYVDAALALRSQMDAAANGQVLEWRQRRYLQAVPDEVYTWVTDHTGRLPVEVPLDFHTDGGRLLVATGLAETVASIPKMGDAIAGATPTPAAAPEPAPAPVAAPEAQPPAEENTSAEAPAPPAPPEEGGEELPLCAACQREGRQTRVETAEQRDVTKLRFREPLCREHGDAAWAARAGGAAAQAPATGPATRTPDPDEITATVPHGQPVARFAPPSDASLRDFLST